MKSAEEELPPRWLIRLYPRMCCVRPFAHFSAQIPPPSNVGRLEGSAEKMQEPLFPNRGTTQRSRGWAGHSEQPFVVAVADWTQPEVQVWCEISSQPGRWVPGDARRYGLDTAGRKRRQGSRAAFPGHGTSQPRRGAGVLPAPPDAVKVGMVAGASIATAIVAGLEAWPGPVVFDPVLAPRPVALFSRVRLPIFCHFCAGQLS